jgi:hypothetical protein
LGLALDAAPRLAINFHDVTQRPQSRALGLALDAAPQLFALLQSVPL